MALPSSLQNGLTPAELAFVAESATVFIQPRQGMPSLQLLDTVLPAFKPPQSVQVPLWLGLLLKRQRRARIIQPDWMNYESLQRLLETEENDLPFVALPLRWLEISSSILETASDDIVEPELTRRLLRDLREVRQAKARKGIETIVETHLQMDNLGTMEIAEIRYLDHALDRLRHLSTTKRATEAEVEE